MLISNPRRALRCWIGAWPDKDSVDEGYIVGGQTSRVVLELVEVRPEVEGAACRHRCVDAATRGVEDGKVSKGGPRGKMGRKVRRERRGL